ncbi:MAG: calcium/sodium antiporter [Pseudomonadota bacterium]
MMLLALIAGFALLLAGGEFLVRGAVGTAARLGVSPVVAGLVIVGFGTSTPELMTSLTAAFAGSPGIAVGNVVGSNICNILLILGITATLFPVAIDPGPFRRDGSVLFVVTAAAVAVIAFGDLTRALGITFVAALLVYVVYTYLVERARHTEAEAVYEGEADLKSTPGLSLWAALGVAAAGLAGVLIGADLLVDSAIHLARAAGVSETIVGLTVVALGTSLPELATAVVAGLRKQTDVAVGNVIGSNIFNVLFILGTTATIKPIPVPPELIHFDVWVMVAATLTMLLFVRTGWRVSRREGALLLLGYVAYVGFAAMRVGAIG